MSVCPKCGMGMDVLRDLRVRLDSRAEEIDQLRARLDAVWKQANRREQQLRDLIESIELNAPDLTDVVLDLRAILDGSGT